jgi:hypothetical protein
VWSNLLHRIFPNGLALRTQLKYRPNSTTREQIHKRASGWHLQIQSNRPDDLMSPVNLILQRAFFYRLGQKVHRAAKWLDNAPLRAQLAGGGPSRRPGQIPRQGQCRCPFACFGTGKSGWQKAPINLCENASGY